LHQARARSSVSAACNTTAGHSSGFISMRLRLVFRCSCCLSA
jgi:hypothetical protein